MMYKETMGMWLQRAADIPPKYRMVEGQRFLRSVDKSHPVRMMMKVKRLKLRKQ